MTNAGHRAQLVIAFTTQLTHGFELTPTSSRIVGLGALGSERRNTQKGLETLP